MRHNRLMQFLADNRRTFTPIEQRIKPPAAAAEGAAEPASEATVYLYDPIVGDRVTAEWWGGVCPQDFVPAIAALDVKTIHLRINCGGGDVFAAEAMCQVLREHGAHVVAHIEGLCASAATAIACACDEVLISSGSKYMIHQAWTMAWGHKGDLRATAELLDKVDETQIQAYQQRTGGDAEQIRQWVEAETWFTADEALAHGFVDNIKDTSSKAAKASASASAEAAPAWSLNAYVHRQPSQASAQAAPTADAGKREHQQRRLRAMNLCAPA